MNFKVLSLQKQPNWQCQGISFHTHCLQCRVNVCVQLSAAATFNTPRMQKCKVQTTTEMCLFLTDWGKRCTQYKVKTTSGSDVLWCVWLAAAGDFLDGEFAAEITEEGIFLLPRNLFILIKVADAQVLKHQSWLRRLCTTYGVAPSRSLWKEFLTKQIKFRVRTSPSKKLFLSLPPLLSLDK